MLKKLIILSLLYFGMSLFGFCFSEDDIAKLEYSKYGEIYTNESISERLTRLENDYFGMTQNGDIDSRINMLSKMTENSKRSAIIDPLESYYPGKKKNSARNFWDNFSSSFSDNGVITGYTPPLYNQGYSNNIYKNELRNSLNYTNGYCPYNSSYNDSLFNRFLHKSNNKINKPVYKRNLPTPHNNLRGRRLSGSYYQMPPNITTRSSVSIIED